MDAGSELRISVYDIRLKRRGEGSSGSGRSRVEVGSPSAWALGV
jgi:hypothetical protein